MKPAHRRWYRDGQLDAERAVAGGCGSYTMRIHEDPSMVARRFFGSVPGSCPATFGRLKCERAEGHAGGHWCQHVGWGEPIRVPTSGGT